MFKIGEIRELIRLLDETGLSEINVELEDMKLHLKKPDGQVETVYTTVAQAPVTAPALAVQAAPVATEAPATAPVAAPAAQDDGLHVITSPMVGTFYRSPSPDSPPFADAGAKVNDKTVVCIVEAMKLMNEIEAEVSGEVVEVLVQNGQLVEYGQPLFKIRLS